jgi:hypothetical protein
MMLAEVAALDPITQRELIQRRDTFGLDPSRFAQRSQ